MSEPAIFALIRDGKKSFFGDRWSSVFLFREILWGPDEFEKWVTQLEPLDDWSDDASGGAVVDFDQRTLAWTGDSDHFRIPKVAAVYQRMLQAAWPRYEIRWEPRRLSALINAPTMDDEDDDENDDNLSLDYDAIQDAAAFFEPEADGEDEGDEESVDSGEPRAWITVIDSAGAIHHRQLLGLSKDLLTHEKGAFKKLISLKSIDVPPEAEVIEGMWIDEPRKTIGLWGGHFTRDRLQLVQESWPGWNVRWADRGYAEQCHVSGPGGTPLTETDALAKFLPIVLSTKRFDVTSVVGFIGGQLKRTAMKATGCLLIVMCSPVLLFGLISGNWRAALITCTVVCAVVVVIFKVFELGFKAKMGETMKPLNQHGNDGQDRALVAGPLDEQDRRQRIDQLLMAAGFPPLKAIEPSFPKDGSLDMLES